MADSATAPITVGTVIKTEFSMYRGMSELRKTCP